MDAIIRKAKTSTLCPISNKSETIHVRKMIQDGTTILAMVTGCSCIFDIDSPICSRCISITSEKINSAEPID